MFNFMKKDPHTKRQKQIRMSDEVRARFETAQKATKMNGEDFIVALLDAFEGKNGMTKAAVMAWLDDSLSG